MRRMVEIGDTTRSRTQAGTRATPPAMVRSRADGTFANTVLFALVNTPTWTLNLEP